MAVDHVADAEPLLHGERDVAVDQIERRIDDHPGARLLAAGDVGEAAPGTKLLEEHRRWWARRASRVKPGWWVYGLVAGGVCDPTRGGAHESSSDGRHPPAPGRARRPGSDAARTRCRRASGAGAATTTSATRSWRPGSSRGAATAVSPPSPSPT